MKAQKSVEETVNLPHKNATDAEILEYASHKYNNDKRLMYNYLRGWNAKPTGGN